MMDRMMGHVQRLFPAALLALLAALFLACAEAGADTGTLPRVDLDVRLDPASRQLEVSATLSAAPGDTPLRWQLSPGARIDEHQLTLPASAAPRTRTLRYRMTLAAPAVLSHRDTLTAASPTAGPEGSFLPAGSLWHPAPLDGGAFTYRVTLTLPAGQSGLVAGRLDEESNGPSNYRARFSFDHPAQGIDLMAGPYRIEERQIEAPAPIRLRTYFHAELQPLARDYLAAAETFLRRHAGEIGPYPYDGFSIVSSPTPTGFGMPSLTYLGIEVLRLPFIRHTSLGHEVLHNWWGNGVFVDYDGGNWCEGLTTFMADYAYKERDNPEAARQMRLAWLRDLSALPPGPALALRTFVARTHGASQIVGYNKAAMLFLMLRDRLGEQRFLQALRTFWQRHRFRQASWMDIQTTFEQVAGEPATGEQDPGRQESSAQEPGKREADGQATRSRAAAGPLSRLFADVLDGTDLPAPVLTEAVMQDDGRLRLTLRQAEPATALRVPLQLLGEFGSLDIVVGLNDTQRTVVLPVPGPATRVRLDPDLRLLRRLPPAEQPPILRQVMIAARVALELPDADTALRTQAQALVAQLLDNAPVSEDASAHLVMGTHDGVDRVLARLGLQRPPALMGRGSAQAWADRTPAGLPVMVVSVRDAAALQALSRPLPHYGGQGYLVFDDAKAIERGQWPSTAQEIQVR